MERTGTSTRKPPEPAESHAAIAGWMRTVMPDLQPVVRHLDETTRENIPSLQFALKWKKAYYGLPDKGWVIEMVSYDVSVNVVFLGGAEFKAPPSLGSGPSRYVKVKSLEEARAPELLDWIKQAGNHPGWQ